MIAVSRRDMLRSTGLLAASPLLLSVPVQNMFAQTSATAASPLPSLDLTGYLVNEHASMIARQINNGAATIDHKALANQWRLLAVHLEDIKFDAQMRTLLPGLIKNGALAHPNASSITSMFDMASQSVAKHGAKLTRDQMLTPMMATLSGDHTKVGKALITTGMSVQCSKVADFFHTQARSETVSLLATPNAGVVPAVFDRRTTSAHFLRVAETSCWKGDTKQEQYNSCYDGETAIAVIIIGVGAIACLLIAACAASLAAAGAVMGGIAGFGTVAALAAWLAGKYCNPILA